MIDVWGVLRYRVGGFKVLVFRVFDFRGVGRKALGVWSRGHRRGGLLEVRHVKLKAQVFLVVWNR